MEVLAMIALVAEKNSMKVVKIAVSSDAQEVVKAIASAYGMKQEVIQSRIYEWFGKQDDIFQRAVLGLLDGLEVDASKAFMERWAQRSRKPDRPAHPAITSDSESERSREAARTKPARQQPQSSRREAIRSGQDESK